ncbi:MAG TPA: pyridoxal phosphate-dependent aminotransferase [Nitrospirales bacterium]|nr:pyridoxal phosphate-dependent aminotransferase [Nitrospirales bacterium]HIN32787.1 pyridoxal phosphate-dependent aminotransferase [Nitrospirales bacterium]
MKLADRLQGIAPSATLEITAYANEMRASGIDVIGLAAGEPDFESPSQSKHDAIQAIEEGFTRYTATSGIAPLKTAIAEKLIHDNHLEYANDEIIVSCGAKHSLFNLMQVLVNPGDEVLIPSPYWLTYPDQVRLHGGVPVFIPTDEQTGFKTTAAQLTQFLTPRTKALVINSPSNPTGAVYDQATLEAIAELAVRHNLVVISDEIYEHFVYDGRAHCSIASLGEEIKARTMVINGVSKAFAMTGWRIGYAAGPKPLISAMGMVQSQSTSNPSSIAQKAAIGALREGRDFYAPLVKEFTERRGIMHTQLTTIPGISCLKPDGAFYGFANVSALIGARFSDQSMTSSSQIATYLLHEAHVAIVPGDPFGAPTHIRISYATSREKIKTGLDRIRLAVQKLQTVTS